MSRSVLRLTVDDARQALRLVDLVAVLAEELLGRTVGGADWERNRAARLTSQGVDPAGDLEVQDDGARFAMPVENLRAFQAAGLAALAARKLLVPGGVTAALVGTGSSVQAELEIIAQYVPDISHVAVYLAGSDAGSLPGLLESSVIDQLELSGIGLSVVDAPGAALFGANLVVVTGDSSRAEFPGLQASQLAAGTVLVNASGHDLPPALTTGVDQIYVDDLGSLADYADRAVVRAHFEADLDSSPRGSRPRTPTIKVDLGQLLAGAQEGRARVEDVVLVELLTVRIPSLWLARQLRLAAVKAGFGKQVES